MKKLSDRQRRRQRFFAIRGPRRRGAIGQEVKMLTADGTEVVLAPSRTVPIPSQFCVVTNTLETFEFINALRKRLLNPPRSGMRVVNNRIKQRRKSSPRWIGPYINFSEIKKISPSAALILASEYDRARILRAKSTGAISRLFLIDVERWHPEVFSVLYDVGFFDLLDIAATTPVDTSLDSRMVRFRSGNQNDMSAISSMLDEIEAMFQAVGLNADDACFELNGALGEAMENSVRCAYPPDVKLPFEHVGQWWMTGSLSRRDRHLSVSIYDQGVSIPGSLSGWRFYEGFTQRFKRVLGLAPDLSQPMYDGQVIEQAIEESATSTYLEKHGKGLGHIKAFVDSCANGRLTIISRNGYYSYSKGQEPDVKSLDVNIGGTLVEWDVWL